MKVAIPTDDGVRIAQRFGRVARFLVAEVGLGAFERFEERPNPGANPSPEPRPSRGTRRKDRHHVVPELLSDCRVVIASSMGEPMRKALSRRGIEIVITSEELIDRVLALFSLAALKDEARIDPDDEEMLPPPADTPGTQDDGFDG